jgi:hypothetical protein
MAEQTGFDFRRTSKGQERQGRQDFFVLKNKTLAALAALAALALNPSA